MTSPFSDAFLAAASTDDTRPSLTYVSVQDGEARCTDGHRIHLAECVLPDGVYLPDGSRIEPEFQPPPLWGFQISEGDLLQSGVRTELQTCIELTWDQVKALRGLLLGIPRGCRVIARLDMPTWLLQWDITKAATKELQSRAYLFPATQADIAAPHGWTATPEAPHINGQYLAEALTIAEPLTIRFGEPSDPIVVGKQAIVMPVWK